MDNEYHDDTNGNDLTFESTVRQIDPLNPGISLNILLDLYLVIFLSDLLS
jgi:hypothetical protein